MPQIYFYILFLYLRYQFTNYFEQVAQKKLVASQVALNESVARLGSSMATGEMECETAANEVHTLKHTYNFFNANFLADSQFDIQFGCGGSVCGSGTVRGD